MVGPSWIPDEHLIGLVESMEAFVVELLEHKVFLLLRTIWMILCWKRRGRGIRRSSR